MLHGTKFQFPSKPEEKLFALKDPNVVVVSVIGKSNLKNQIPSKISSVNEYFQHPIFQNDTHSDESTIEGYYCPARKVLFLYCISVYDTNTLSHMFDNVGESISEKGFLSVWSDLRNLGTRHMLFMFLVSHIVVVTNSGSHFDLNYIQLFKTIETVRLKVQNGVTEVLKLVPGLPRLVDSGSLMFSTSTFLL